MKQLICPHCGNDIEFYTKERYKGICNFYLRTDNKEADNGEMYSNAEHSLASKFVFCAECNKKVCRVEELGGYQP